MTCLSCSRGFHDECPKGEPCCCSHQEISTLPQAPFTAAPKGIREVSVSAGRKEAATLYPIDRDAACEWRGLANCGGGLHPIVGCIDGKQVHRHHGPNKNTTDNRRENIHLICKSCHERWHAKNNGPYKENPAVYLTLPHKPRAATAEELTSVKTNSIIDESEILPAP